MCTNEEFKKVICYVNEMASQFRGPAKVEVSTRYFGVRVNNTLYLKAAPDSEQYDEDTVLVVNTNECLRMPVMFGNYTTFAFNTDEDQLPCENYKLKFMNISEISEEIQIALDQALIDYNAYWVAA